MPNSLAMTGGGLHFDTFMKALAGVQPEKAKPRKKNETKDLGEGKEKSPNLESRKSYRYPQVRLKLGIVRPLPGNCVFGQL